MATLRELWDAYPKDKLPMRARRLDWDSGEYFDFRFLDSLGQGYGTDTGGAGDWFAGEDEGWVLVPKMRRVERWLWVVKLNKARITPNRWMTETEARDTYKEICGKVPGVGSLVTEEPET